MTFEERRKAGHEALWTEMQVIETVIRADAAAAYHREIARAEEASAHFVIAKIWPESRRDELQQYRLPVATTDDGLPGAPSSESGGVRSGASGKEPPGETEAGGTP